MGKHWKPYRNGPYRLGQLKGQAVVTWRDASGKRHRVRLGKLTEVEARSELDSWVRRRCTLETGGRYTIGEIWKAYRDDKAQDGKQISAFDFNWKALEPTFGRLFPADLTADLCRRYTRERCYDQGRSQGTAWTELQRLRSCMNWALKKRLVDYAPDIWVPQKPAGKDRVLSDEEFGRLLDGCVMPHIRVFIAIALSTGARTQAILDLTWDRVDWNAGLVNFKVKPVNNPLLKTARKSRAIVPMTAWLVTTLQNAQAGAITDYVVEWNGARVKSIRKGFSEACRRAGLSGVSPHTLRHTAASWLESGGIPVGVISRFLAHSSEAVTRNIYSKPDAEILRPAADILDITKRARVR